MKVTQTLTHPRCHPAVHDHRTAPRARPGILMYVALAQPSLAGIIQSITGVVTVFGIVVASTAGILQIRKLRQEGHETNDKLDVIHTLVNSTLTASIESDLGATKQYVTTMEQLMGELKRTRQPVPPETMAALAEARKKADDLTQQVADRLKSAEHLLTEQKNPQGVLPAVRT
jgi:hypothetical protein